MSTQTRNRNLNLAHPLLVGLLAGTLLALAPFGAFAQSNPAPAPQSSDEEQQPPESTRQPGQEAEPAPPDAAPAPPVQNQAPAMQPGPEAPTRPGWHRFGPPASQAAPQQDPDAPLPPRLNLQLGSYITVRIDRYLSSDKNRVGDGFTATLMQPVIVDGIVVAQRGQVLGGRVADAQKAGRVKGVSRLGIELTNMTLVDGTQAPIRTQLEAQLGPTSKARDAAAIGTSTGLGAAIGGAASGGAGAAIGAGGGALASTIGVLLTRGRPTEIYPETELTFRLAAPVVVNTTRAPQAFRAAGPDDYRQRGNGERAPHLRPRPCYGCAVPPPYYAYGPYPYYYPYWGPSFSFWYTPGFFYGHRYGGGFHGRGFHH